MNRLLRTQGAKYMLPFHLLPSYSCPPGRERADRQIRAYQAALLEALQSSQGEAVLSPHKPAHSH